MARTKISSVVAASQAGEAKQRSLPQAPTSPPVDKGVLLLRSDKRSWFSVAITGFGGVLVQYLKTVRERLRAVRTRSPRVRPGRVRRRP